VNTTRPAEDQLLGWMQSLSNWGRWGADDQRGTLNLVTPERTLHALSLVRTGQLGHRERTGPVDPNILPLRLSNATGSPVNPIAVF
jgi:hypothetical protein